MFNLTDNELAAAITLYKSCLSNMGGKCYDDLESDPFTWVDITDLTDTRHWSKHEASGTFASLAEKGVIEEYEDKEWTLTMRAAKWLDGQEAPEWPAKEEDLGEDPLGDWHGRNV